MQARGSAHHVTWSQILASIKVACCGSNSPSVVRQPIMMFQRSFSKFRADKFPDFRLSASALEENLLSLSPCLHLMICDCILIVVLGESLSHCHDEKHGYLRTAWLMVCYNTDDPDVSTTNLTAPHQSKLRLAYDALFSIIETIPQYCFKYPYRHDNPPIEITLKGY